MKLDNGKKVELDPAKARHIEHGYAVDGRRAAPAERVLVSIAGAPEIAQNSAVHKPIASASRDAAIYISELAILRTPTPAVLPSDRPAQQQPGPQETKEQKEAIEISPSISGAKLVLEPAKRMSTWAEHTVKWNPINQALTPPEANQFEWRAQSDTIQSYRHIETGRHLHIDGPSGQFYDQDRNPITKGEALAQVMPGDRAHSQDKTSHGFDRNNGIAGNPGQRQHPVYLDVRLPRYEAITLASLALGTSDSPAAIEHSTLRSDQRAFIQLQVECSG